MKSVEFNNLTKQDFDKMSFKDLRHLISEQSQISNKRIKNIEARKGEVSQSAVGQVKRTGGKFHTTGKTTKNQLIKEAKRIQTFNKKKASTVAGAREVRKEAMRIRGEEPDKKKKKTKSLRKIKSDINKKAKKIESEKGKEEAKKYKKRAMGQYKSIQRKRKEEREREKIKYRAPINNGEDFDDFDDFASDDLDTGSLSGNKISASNLINGYEEAKKREQEQQSFMPGVSEDWSSVFI